MDNETPKITQAMPAARNHPHLPVSSSVSAMTASATTVTLLSEAR